MNQPQTQHTLNVGPYMIDKSNLLGKGATANVYRATNTQTGQTVAVKIIDHSTITNQVTQYLLEGEIKAHKTLDAPFIIKTHDVINDGQFTYIFMQQCLTGTLKSYIQNSPNGRLSQQQALEIFQKIVTGYISIIDSLFIHRDLKTANILMKQNGDPVIIDFGYCQMIMGNNRPMIQYNVGSPSYMSPQAYGKSRYSEKSDIWALGVILYEMVKGTVLDEGINIKQFFNMIQKQRRININYEGLGKVSQQIMEATFKYTPQERATSHKIKYIIDKSMISMMQAKLNRKVSQNSSGSYHSIRNQPKMISHGHIINNPMNRKNSQQNMRSSISVKDKVIPNKQHHKNSQNSTVVYHTNMPPTEYISKNQRNSYVPIPGMHPPMNRRTLDRNMPPPSFKRIVSVRELGENEKMFLKKNGPPLQKTNSATTKPPNGILPLSMRII